MLDKAAADEIERIIGYEFKDKAILIRAFTHSSYANEHCVKSNERLEFLGDAILNFAVAEKLFFQSDSDEGIMSKNRSQLVSRQPLSEIIEKTGLLKFILYGDGVERGKLSDKFKSNLFEAVLGAIYVDSGSLSSAKKFIERFLPVNSLHSIDYKSLLQEKLQGNKTNWEYRTSANEKGGFTSVLNVGGVTFYGNGAKKREAEREVAKKACNYFKYV